MQMRKIKPKVAASAPPGQGATRRQRERYVQAGGMLQGYAPDFVIRLGYIAMGVGVACLLAIAALIIFVTPVYGLPVAIAAALAWVLPIALLASFIAPGFRLALRDRRREARLGAGERVGARPARTPDGPGLGGGEHGGGSRAQL